MNEAPELMQFMQPYSKRNHWGDVAEQSPRSDGASALRPQERPEREETFWVDTTIFNH